jgi:hypothetical protein
MLSVSAITLYIYTTYYPYFYGRHIFHYWYPTLIFCIHGYFLIEYLLRLYSAKQFSIFFLSGINICEIASIFPYFILAISITDQYHYALYFARMLDLLRMVSLFRLSKHIENDINRELSIIVIGVSK